MEKVKVRETRLWGKLFVFLTKFILYQKRQKTLTSSSRVSCSQVFYLSSKNNFNRFRWFMFSTTLLIIMEKHSGRAMDKYQNWLSFWKKNCKKAFQSNNSPRYYPACSRSRQTRTQVLSTHISPSTHGFT